MPIYCVHGILKVNHTISISAMNHPEWHAFHAQNLEQKLELFTQDNRLFDILYAEQFTIPFLEHIFAIADKVRDIAKTKHGKDFLSTVLSDKRALLFFVQPSTRTFLSFENACHCLGMKTSEIRDTSTSSEVKGESLEDSVRTFSSYVDIIITRHFDAGFAEHAAWTLNKRANRSIPVINGGSGKDQHPTQALLDMYTLNRAFAANSSNFSNKHYGMVGDLRRGRTVRSLCKLLSLYNDVTFHLISPAPFKMDASIIDELKSKGAAIHETDDFEGTIGKVDALYCTRIQDEYDTTQGESNAVDCSSFDLTKKHLSKLKKEAVILHPFPRRNEIHVDVDSDPRAYYWKQARNGMWARIALLIYLFNRESYIQDYPLG